MRWLHFSLGYTRNKEVCVHLILYYILLLTTLVNWIIFDKDKLILICNLCRHLGNIFRFESMSKSNLNKKFMGHYKLNICHGLIFQILARDWGPLPPNTGYIYNTSWPLHETAGHYIHETTYHNNMSWSHYTSTCICMKSGTMATYIRVNYHMPETADHYNHTNMSLFH